jgi:hypothetical protein
VLELENGVVTRSLANRTPSLSRCTTPNDKARCRAQVCPKLKCVFECARKVFVATMTRFVINGD